MKKGALIAGLAVAVLLILWLARYEVANGVPMVLDRWTGKVIILSNGKVVDLANPKREP